MIRSILSIGILLVVIIWLALSYLSGTYIVLPTIEITAFLDATMLQWGLVVILISFVAIQVEIVRATVQKLGKRGGPQQILSMNRAVEGIWALLPLLATIALVAVYLSL